VVLFYQAVSEKKIFFSVYLRVEKTAAAIFGMIKKLSLMLAENKKRRGDNPALTL